MIELIPQRLIKTTGSNNHIIFSRPHLCMSLKMLRNGNKPNQEI